MPTETTTHPVPLHDAEREARIQQIAAQLDAMPADGSLWSVVIDGVKVRRGGIRGRLFVLTTYHGARRDPQRRSFEEAGEAARYLVEASR